MTCIQLVTLFLLAVPVLAAPAGGGARNNRSNLPITIKASQLTADNKGKKAVFTGKVVAKQGDITIFSDKLTIYYGTNKNEVEKIEADGNVRIVQENRVGSAAHAVYDSREGKITLSGGTPRVTQGADSTTGKIITYLIDDERSTVIGETGAPVVTIIHPRERKNNDAPR
jgi:lipopolysaccharide export system protein LptA